MKIKYQKTIQPIKKVSSLFFSPTSRFENIIQQFKEINKASNTSVTVGETGFLTLALLIYFFLNHSLNCVWVF